MDEGTRLLADELERLMKLPLNTKAEVEHWYSEAERVRSAFERFAAFDLPHHIWHYFSDADIRARDPEYKKTQDQAISGYINQVRSSRGAI